MRPSARERKEASAASVLACLARGHTHDVLTVDGGVGSEADNSTDRLREWDSDKGRGSKNPKFLRTLYVNGPERRSGFSKNYFTVGSISSSRRKLEGEEVHHFITMINGGSTADGFL